MIKLTLEKGDALSMVTQRESGPKTPVACSQRGDWREFSRWGADIPEPVRGVVRKEGGSDQGPTDCLAQGSLALQPPGWRERGRERKASHCPTLDLRLCVCGGGLQAGEQGT